MESLLGLKFDVAGQPCDALRLRLRVERPHTRYFFLFGAASRTAELATAFTLWIHDCDS